MEANLGISDWHMFVLVHEENGEDPDGHGHSCYCAGPHRPLGERGCGELPGRRQSRMHRFVQGSVLCHGVL